MGDSELVSKMTCINTVECNIYGLVTRF